MDARVDWRSDEAGAAPRVKARMLPGAPGLEFVEAEPDFAPTGAPVLFVHGAFAGAWMWREVFMPFFARRGRACAAVSLRGHGGSEGRAGLRAARLSDYRDDLQRAFAALPEPPVVVAHSLGGLLAQQLIGREEMRALALLASLPPKGCGSRARGSRSPIPISGSRPSRARPPATGARSAWRRTRCCSPKGCRANTSPATPP